MTLANSKNSSSDFLRLIMGFIFISAGLYRIFNPDLAILELDMLSLPQYLVWPVVIFEILGGLCLVLKVKYWRLVSYLFAVYLAIAIIFAFRMNAGSIFDNLSELFIFNPSPTDILLHSLFIIILFILAKGKK